MFAFYFYWLGLRDIRGRMPRKLGRVSWTEILYIFVVLFLIIYGTYFIMRRALAFGARVRGLDHCARCTAQRLWRAVGLFELYEHMWRTCLDSAADRADITPPIQSLFVPLDVSHMSRIVTGAKSWNMISLCPVHGLLSAMADSHTVVCEARTRLS